MNHASGGHVHPTDHGDAVPALLSPGGMLTNMTLFARLNGKDYELGTMTVGVPVHPSKDNPLLWEAADIEPTLAAALREAADAIENGEE